jgi:DNA topoisomerase-1
MATNLVIVESPAKSVTITKYLNSNPKLKSLGKFVVLASYGHVRDLPKKSLGIDVEHDFEPTYQELAEKKEVIEKLKKAAKEAKVIYLASDLDRSGAFISESLRVVLNLGNNYHRITFNEITDSALEYAVLHPGKIDEDGVKSEETRRTLDRLVGFKLSPLLWKKFTSGSITLSAGRVQSAVMHLIIQREKEIEAFKSSAYWHMNGNFTLTLGKDTTSLEEVKLYKDNNVHKVDQEKEVHAFLKTIKNNWSISNFKTHNTKQNPDAPFITTTLQQEASGKLRMGIKRIMAVAQELYEQGHITYMRTDSFNMSETFKAQAKTYIMDNYGANYYEGGILRKKAVKGAQEAHECIRVTDVKLTELPAKFGKDHKELYKLIWQRSVAFLMKPAEFDELEIFIKDAGMTKPFNFISTFKRVKFNGFLIVYDVKNETKDFTSYTKALKEGDYKLSCSQVYVKNTWQSPPARYNDAGLVKLMETNGLGRPSTVSTILEKLFDKTYVIKTDIKGTEQATQDFMFIPSNKTTKSIKGTTMVGAEQNKVKPTDIGIQVDAYLTETFDYIVDKDFTANMEKDLDDIGEGKATKLAILKQFWSKFSKTLDEQTKKKEAKREIKSETRELKVNNKTYTIRIGPYGPLAEYEDPKAKNKKGYIGLKGYLQLVKKEYLDVNEDDIKYLLDMPKVMGKVDNKDVTLHFGPFGPYLKHNNLNIKIPRFALKEFGETKEFTQEQLKSFIEYAKNKPAKSPQKTIKKAKSKT